MLDVLLTPQNTACSESTPLGTAEGSSKGCQEWIWLSQKVIGWNRNYSSHSSEKMRLLESLTIQPSRTWVAFLDDLTQVIFWQIPFEMVCLESVKRATRRVSFEMEDLRIISNACFLQLTHKRVNYFVIAKYRPLFWCPQAFLDCCFVKLQLLKDMCCV